MEESAPLAPPPPPPPANLESSHTLEPISRPSSTSTQNSMALPGISSIAGGSPATSSPQLRATHVPAGTPYSGLPTCQNCQTSTTPLWRRDEQGAILCNACGLFLKLHGRPRPISLKTDVIKSRNRVKTSMRPDVAMRKKNMNMATSDGMGALADATAAQLQGQANAATAAMNARRVSQNNGNGHIEGVDSPNSRTGTPNIYSPHLAGYPAMDDSQYHLAGFGASSTADAQTSSSMNGDRAEAPQTQEQLIAANASLKTRVAELEVINDFIQRRLGNYETGYTGVDGQESNAEIQALRAQLESATQTETQLRTQLEESHRRENMFKRRLDEMEVELKKYQEAAGGQPHDYNGRAKRPRIEGSADVFIDAPEQPEQQPDQHPEQIEELPKHEQPAAATTENPVVVSETPAAA